MRYIDIPICINSDDDMDNTIKKIRDISSYLDTNDLHLNLDMDALPEVQKYIIDKIDNKRINIVYNIGYIMYLGYDNERFLDLLFDRIRNVVIYNCGTGGEQRKIDGSMKRFRYQLDELKKRGYKYNYRIQNTVMTRESVDVYLELLNEI